MSYYNFTKRPSKTSSRQKLVHKLDDVFSEYIRLRDVDEYGMVKCITCGEELHWLKEAQCGHYILRGNMATRFELQNCHPQCGLCNSTHDGKAEEHAKAIDLKYGPGTADKLERMGREERHFSEHELQGMIDELKKEIKAIKEERFR